MRALWALLAWLLALTATLIVVTVLQQNHLAQASQQLAALQAQNRAASGRLAAAQASIAGTHRDLLTCADLQNMGLQYTNAVSLSNDSNGNIYANLDQSPVSLPAHCINH